VARKNVLIVDDDDTMRKLLVIEFKRRGHKVFEYLDTVSALETIKKEKPPIDAAVIDLMQKGYGGNLGEELRKFPEYKSTTVIYYSALTPDQFNTEILEHENTFYVQKVRGSINELIEKIESL